MDVPVATGYDPLLDTEPELARTMAASVKQRIAFGERAGEKVRRIGSGFGYEGERPELTGPRCASVNGFSLHANTDIPAHRRDQLERLMRYTRRGAVALERLTEGAKGDLVYLFTRPWSNGTTGIKLALLELLEKLSALVPLPRAHLVRYSGWLAPHSKLRAAIIPTPRQQGMDGDASRTGTPYWNWARLLGRVFDLELGTCLPFHLPLPQPVVAKRYVRSTRPTPASLAEAAQLYGTTIRTGTVRGLQQSHGRVTGVQLDGGTLACDTVVLAMGPWAQEAEAWLGLSIPVRPLKGEILPMEFPGPGLAYDFASLTCFCSTVGARCGVVRPRSGVDLTPPLAPQHEMHSSPTRYNCCRPWPTPR
jgi:hypothetical protein